MLFSAGIFWIFFLVVLLLLHANYVVSKSLHFQNALLLLASYFFYGFWDWRFLSIIIFVSAQTYFASILLRRYDSHKGKILTFSIAINLLILGYFKYANFFVAEFMSAFDLENSFSLENIILPVGISFYIFQSFTYVIDVYLKKIEPEESLLNYFTFIAFFPQLVAGPIERASALLPQFRNVKKLRMSSLYVGTKICIIGLFLKIFIADNLASDVDAIFAEYGNQNGKKLLLGALGFTVQIYGDFAGYSLIAIGVAKIMGFELMRNFHTPYFSTSIQDFWRRWHISLSSFFRDYIYIPLGGSRARELIVRRNLLVTFVASGLWHGANWTFILWGAAHGALLILQRAFNLSLQKYLSWAMTMIIVICLWVLFRSESVSDFYNYIYLLVTDFGIPSFSHNSMIVFFFYYLALDLILLRYKEQGETWFGSIYFEVFVLSVMMMLTVGTMHSVNPNFIYFQF